VTLLCGYIIIRTYCCIYELCYVADGSKNVFGIQYSFENVVLHSIMSCSFIHFYVQQLQMADSQLSISILTNLQKKTQKNLHRKRAHMMAQVNHDNIQWLWLPMVLALAL
jgi:hypothetical protein